MIIPFNFSLNTFTIKNVTISKRITRNRCLEIDNNKICSRFNMIKQEAALVRVHSNLSQSKLMLEHLLKINIKSGIF